MKVSTHCLTTTIAPCGYWHTTSQLLPLHYVDIDTLPHAYGHCTMQISTHCIITTDIAPCGYPHTTSWLPPWYHMHIYTLPHNYCHGTMKTSTYYLTTAAIALPTHYLTTAAIASWTMRIPTHHITTTNTAPCEYPHTAHPCWLISTLFNETLIETRNTKFRKQNTDDNLNLI